MKTGRVRFGVARHHGAVTTRRPLHRDGTFPTVGTGSAPAAVLPAVAARAVAGAVVVVVVVVVVAVAVAIAVAIAAVPVVATAVAAPAVPTAVGQLSTIVSGAADVVPTVGSWLAGFGAASAAVGEIVRRGA